MVLQKLISALHHYTPKNSALSRWRSFFKRPIFSGILLVLMSWGGFFLYFWPQMFHWTAKGLEAGWLFIWADWSAHLTYTNVFVHRPLELWLSGHPLYVGQKFSYPFATNLVSALLMRMGWDVVPAFIVPSIVMTLWLLVVLLLFYKQISRSVSRAYVGVTLFLAGGGLGFYTFFQDVAEFGWQNILYPARQATQFEAVGLRWYNVITGQLLPQRAFLFGLPWFLSVALWLENWRQRHFHGWKWWRVSLAGVFAGFLAFVHMHSYIVLVIACAVLALWYWRAWKFWLFFAAGAFFPSLLVYSLLYGGEVGVSFFRWYPGWLANSQAFGMNWGWFWILNWGVFLPLAAIGTFLRKHALSPWIVVGWVLFALANMVLFQPYDWDNSKILTYAYLLLVPAVLHALLAVWNLWQNQSLFFRRNGQFFALLLFVSLTLSGWIDIWRVSYVEKHSYQMISHEDIGLASAFRQISEPTDRSLTSDAHNLWLPMMTGRPVVMGYRGWLWSYGIRYDAVQRDVATMYSGGEAAEQLIDQYAVKFVVIDLGAERDWRPNEAYYAERYPLVLSGQYSRVYQVRD